MRSSILFVCVMTLMLLSCQSNKKPDKKSIMIGGEKRKVSSEFLLGEKLYKGKGNCYSCHRVDKKSIGPSIKEIVKIYKEKNGNIINFLRQKQDPIVDPENYAVMKTNFVLLERFSDKELKALEVYMNDVIKE